MKENNGCFIVLIHTYVYEKEFMTCYYYDAYILLWGPKVVYIHNSTFIFILTSSQWMKGWLKMTIKLNFPLK